MFLRQKQSEIAELLTWSPVVGILGARQVGKTTLAKSFLNLANRDQYVDLDSALGQAKLIDPIAFFAANRDHLVILDEIQNAPDILALLRGEIDSDRRPGRFLILGSASFNLLRQSQSLAGRLALVDMSPLLASEVVTQFVDVQTLWLRGGFPNSYLAASNNASWRWRDAFVRHFLNTDLPMLGIQVEPQLMQRYWRMLAHLQGQLFNASAIGASLGVSTSSASRYLDHLCNTLVVRRLEPHYVNLGKRLVKSPKVYVRDSGLLHYLQNIRVVDDLHGHPVTGASWEGFVEQIANHLPLGAQMSFYRTASGTEMDVVVEIGNRKIGFEAKFSSAPVVSKGFWLACDDLMLDAAYVVSPVEQGWPIKAGAQVISVLDIPRLLQAS
jgi:uncharacterized protein